MWTCSPQVSHLNGGRSKVEGEVNTIKETVEVRANFVKTVWRISIILWRISIILWRISIILWRISIILWRISINLSINQLMVNYYHCNT
jgi:hypothetical protein